ncbi:hypothetical protein MYX64_08215 [Nitrospinae bacterium AH_259_B05_G02_I21]|nr:hypothetical protein [Nitrospinae bacterium AH_259_B05_G02_I21]MDA2932470.1 hypothetical protein [Nitrospinae bacterium AH-259-F20]
MEKKKTFDPPVILRIKVMAEESVLQNCKTDAPTGRGGCKVGKTPGVALGS